MPATGTPGAALRHAVQRAAAGPLPTHAAGTIPGSEAGARRHCVRDTTSARRSRRARGDPMRNLTEMPIIRIGSRLLRLRAAKSAQRARTPRTGSGAFLQEVFR
jgi:hypothetical protein